MADVLSTGPDRPRPPRWPKVAGAVLVGVAAVAVLRGQLGSPPDHRADLTAAAPVVVPTSTAPPGPACPTPTGPDGGQIPPPVAAVALVPPAPRTTGDQQAPAAATRGPWSVVLRAPGGSLGRHGAVVTYPVDESDLTHLVWVDGLPGRSGPGVVVWSLDGRYARVRGDMPAAELLRIAAATTLRGCQPVVRPPAGYTAVFSGPYRSSSIHEIRYGSDELGPSARELGDFIYTGVTACGAFEDQLYELGRQPAGVVGGRPAVVSAVYGGNATLAWEPAPGAVAYVGYSGGEASAATTRALHDLAVHATLLTPAQWLATHPQTYQEADPPR
jgi:hypothetical protein